MAQIGDFGILVRSGFSVGKALFFNFLSALVALAGTAMVSTVPVSIEWSFHEKMNEQFNNQSTMAPVGIAHGEGSRTFIID